MLKRKEVLALAVGVVLSVMLTPVAAGAVQEWVRAEKSSQTFTVDGKQVQMEAYAINGNNYVKLRDIGKAVNFDVSYDAQTNTAAIDSSKPYFDDEAAPPSASSVPDYSKEANPDIFGELMTPTIYNAIRDSIVHQDEIIAGTYKPAVWNSGLYNVNCSPLADIIWRLGQAPLYEFKSDKQGETYCNARYPECDQKAIEHTQPFIDSLGGLSGREKVSEIAYYVADRIIYEIERPILGKVLSQDEQIPGCCVTYANCFQFLCGRAGIPCLLLSSDDGEGHMFNEVYLEGAWWRADITANDAGDDLNHEYWEILDNPDTFIGYGYVDDAPEKTAIVKELLVPGSSKATITEKVAKLAEKSNPTVSLPSAMNGSLYGALYYTMLHRDEILAGNYPLPLLGNTDRMDVPSLTEILGNLGLQYTYSMQLNNRNEIRCAVSEFEPVKPAVHSVQPFIESIKDLDAAEQVRQIVWHVCDHMSYDLGCHDGPTNATMENGKALRGVCADYAHWVKLLCEQAGIPCVMPQSADHQWNSVFVDGKWYDVDACWFDEKPGKDSPELTANHRASENIFRTPGSWGDSHHTPLYPDAIELAKKLLVPSAGN